MNATGYKTIPEHTERVAESAVQSWQKHLKQCAQCGGVIKLGQHALLYSLCHEGRTLYYPAWQADTHRVNPGAKS